MIKSARFFRLTKAISTETLNKAFIKHRFAPITSQSVLSVGFVPINEESALVHAVAGIRAGALRVDKKSIPSSAVKEQVKIRAKLLEAQQGFAPGRKQMHSLKEDVLMSLIPHAIPSTSIVRYFIWDDLMVIDTTSASTADRLLTEMSKALSTEFPFQLLQTESSAGSMMTHWLTTDEHPVGFTVDRDAEMKAPNETKSSVRWKNDSINVQEAQEHMRQGKQVVKLALSWKDKIRFSLSDKLVVSGVKPLEILSKRTTEDVEKGDLDGEIALFGGEFKRLADDLIQSLGGDFK